VPFVNLVKVKNMPLVLSIADEKLNSFLAQFEKNVISPQNASLKIEGTNISIIPEKDGYALNKTEIKENIQKEVGYLVFAPITVAVASAKPSIYQDGVAQAKSDAEKIMSLPLTLTYQDKTFTASSAQIGLFIAFSEKDNKLAVSLNDGEIDKYVAGLASKIDIKPVDSEKLSTTGQITKEGTDGLALDRADTKTQIKEALTGSDKNIALLVSEKKHGEKTVFPDNVAVGGRFSGKYIDIDLSEQKLSAFDGENLVRAFLVSTGLRGTPTPTGTFSIYSRSRSSLMAGPGYYLPNVQWVNRFNESRSIHGTYWHHNFGHPMSHGCVNATNGDAEFIYTWAPMGTPVFIHQ
jgi:lipoprotein-anchoring transpeptidase ErfK/SrfK